MLDGLSNRAAKSASLDEFRSALNSDESDELPNVADAWGTDSEETWRFLQHVHVEHHPREVLGGLVHLTYELLVQGDPDAAIDALGSWLTKHLQEVLTAPEIWAYLSGAGFPRRPLAGDPDTLAALTATIERQRRRADAAQPAIGLVDLVGVLSPTLTAPRFTSTDSASRS